MRKQKQALALVLALVMVIAMLPTVAFAADYADTKGHWAEAQIDRWSDFKVVQGTGNGFNPEGKMTRAEAAQTFSNLLKLSKKADLTSYTDVPTDAWKVEALAKAVAKGIINGSNSAGTTLSPDGTLTREQMFVMIGRALGIKPAETATKTFVDGAETSKWAAGYINALVNMGAIKGTGHNELNPADDINRASVMSALDQLIGGYANEDGQTVTIVPGKITLVVADEVKVTGTADPTMPIVVAGEAAKVDMEGVKGEATVQVQTSDVAVENAPEGTSVTAAEDATGVTANGAAVVAGGEPTAAPAPTPTPTPETTASPSPATPAPLPPVITPTDEPTTEPTDEPSTEPSTEPSDEPSTEPSDEPKDDFTETDIDDIFNTEKETINSAMNYAKLSDVVVSDSERKITVTMWDGEKTVVDIYNDIVTPLITALVNHKTELSTITAVKDIADGTTFGENGTLDLSTLENSEQGKLQIVNFVKAVVPSVHGVSKIGELLNGESFQVKVADKETGSAKTEPTYTVEFVLDNLDEEIEDQVTALNDAMTYATVAYDKPNHKLTVTIDDEDTTVTQVYDDIQEILMNAMNMILDSITKVEADKYESGTVTLEYTDEITGSNIATFVRHLKFAKDSVESMEVKPDTQINTLKGYKAEVKVTFKYNEEPVTYTISFAEGN